MNRRSFLKNIAAGGAIAAGLGLGLGTIDTKNLMAADYPDLVAVRGTSLTDMYDKGLEALGG
jgi:hypothetical protein